MLSSFPTRIFKSNSKQTLRPSSPLFPDSPVINHHNAAFCAGGQDVIKEKPITHITDHSQFDITALPLTVDAPTTKHKREFNLFRRSPAVVKGKGHKSTLASIRSAMGAPLKILKLASRKKKVVSKRHLVISSPMNFKHETSGGGGLKRNSRGSWVNPNRTSTIQVLDERGRMVLDTMNEDDWEDVEQ